jgi:lipopolysaccharide export system protein LptC
MSPAQQSARERMLDTLRRRNPDMIALMARRNRFVTVSKALLPVIAVLILIALVLAPTMHDGPGEGRITYKLQAKAPGAASTMEGAQYRGVDQQGQPFTLTANTANPRGPTDIALAKPQGDITLTSGAWLMLKSDAGMFDQKLQTLGLNGNVTLYRNDGTTMTGPDAKIDLKQGSATSTSPVQAAGPFGTLNAAGGSTITNRGQDVLFHGPVKLVLNQANTPAPAPVAQ